MRRPIVIILVFCLTLSLSAPAFATEAAIDLNELSNTFHDSIDGGDIFVQETNGKLVTIMTNEDEQLVTISIKYDPESNTVYQWILESYPVNPFTPESLSFWTNIINYAEDRMDEATVVEFIVETTTQSNARSSAGADLYADLVSIVGSPYSDTFVEVRSIEGHGYRLYETLEFNIRNITVNRWSTAITIASLITGVLGLTVGTGTINTVCTILGIASTVASTIVPAGALNKYECMAMYTRYITVDGSSRHYSEAYKFKTFYGYEDADTNSTGRAKIFGQTVMVYYGTTAEYYTTGLWQEAYDCYNNIDY